MKKIAFSLLAAVTMFFMACGSSKINVQEASSQCDVMIEVRQVLNDSISWLVNNNLYLNAKQVIPDDMYPILVSTRDPADWDRSISTTIINSDEDLINLMRKVSPEMTQIGLVIGETAANEIGFDEADAINKVTAIFKKMGGGSMYLFHDKNGELVDGKVLY